MANFIQEKYNSMPEQVQENKHNINELINYIKPVYKSLIALTIATTSIAIASTNAPDDTTSGWLIDENGLLFHITSGDGTNLLIDYYATLKGAKGDQGEPGITAIDDNATALDKTWSSQKISDKIDLISDKGIYYTFVQPTLVDTQYELNTSDLENPNQYTFQKYNDIIVYIDGDGKVKEIYNCVGVQGDFSKIYLEKVGEIGGKQLYQHNIAYDRTAGGASAHYNIIEITDDATEINTRALFKQWLTNRGYNIFNPRIVNGGWYYAGSNTWYGAVSIWVNNNDHIEIRYSTGMSYQTNEDVSEVGQVSDQVKPL